MGEDHIGICECRRRESHWDLRVRRDLHLNGYRALTLLEGLFADVLLDLSSSCMPICAIKRHKHSRIRRERENFHDAQDKTVRRD